MPTCQNCHKKWTWKQTIKKSFTLGGGMKCPYCSEMQYFSLRFRKRGSIIPFTIIGLIMLSNVLFGPSYIFVLLLIGLIPVYLGVYPFLVELSNEDEPLW